MLGSFKVSKPVNEPVFSYAPGTPEREALKKNIQELRSKEVEIPLIIGGKRFKTGTLGEIRAPHDHQHLLGRYHQAGEQEIKQAIETAIETRKEWSEWSWEDRAAVFLKAADLLASPHRMLLNAATMLGQSKNVFQAEIDSACELIDFLRFNTYFMWQIYNEQPFSVRNQWNKIEYRPLEGFVFAVSPFNFTSINGNLPTAPAIMGNVVLFKPASTSVYSSYFFMEILEEAGLPGGVINFIPFQSRTGVGSIILKDPNLAGIHFTGSTSTFQSMWRTIGENISNYNTYPRIVGETGGKDFIFAHESADIKALTVAILRGSFEYSGQKCSASSRAYIPDDLWEKIKPKLVEGVKSMKMGGVEDFSNLINAVIDKASFDNIKRYIDAAKNAGMEFVVGGNYDESKGYFIEPTIIRTVDPGHFLLCEEIFGPVLAVYVYSPDKYEETLHLCDETSPYGLTGSIFAQDRRAIVLATKILRNAAGNFYINDKPTGAVVGQQPFGGARASGTNDKAGSWLNLIRWVSARTIKENFLSPTDYRYPFMESA
ncbi:MAG: L-glutamate gamma-semialdehyde dehydrogenase [Promethearchaeota archaeon]